MLIRDSCGTYDDILFFDGDFSKVTFYPNQMGIFGLYADKIILNDNHIFYEDDLDTIIHVWRLAWHNQLEKRKVPKKR